MLRERRRHANYKPNRKLDRKSSRGMIYENEELRLRTININAEVERGQSDIRKLRRENEQLKREIWSLRDEYDRVNKKQVCANKNCSSCENISNSDSQSEDSDYCEVCRDHEPPFDGCHRHGVVHEDLEHEEKVGLLPVAAGGVGGAAHSIQATYGSTCSTSKEAAENYENAQKTLTQTTTGVMTPTPSLTQLSMTTFASSTPPPPPPPPSIVSVSGPIASTSVAGLRSSSPLFGLSTAAPLASATTTAASGGTRHNCKVPASVDSVSSKLRENLHVNFGQLSVLSEETLTNSDGASSVHENGDSDATMMMMMMMQSMPLDDNTPVSPLHEIQSIQPPLSHFENIPYEPRSPSSPNRTTSDPMTTMADECRVNPNESCRDFSTTQQLMSRSVDAPTGCADQQPGGGGDSRSTTAETTTPQFRSPKHFFSPINPRLKAPQQPSTPPILATALYPNPPDLFVANALASPCHRPVISMESVPAPSLPLTQQQPFIASVPVPPPPLPVIPVPYNSDSSFYEGNLEDLLFEIETLQIQLEKHKSLSQEKLPTQSVEPFAANPLTRPKPYRSEMNLVVSCNGCKSSITPITKQTSASLMSGFDYKSDTAVYPTHHIATAAAAAHHSTNSSSFVMDTPPPNIPQPMILFPQNLTYLTRETGEHGGGGGSVPVLTEIGFGALLDDYHQFHRTHQAPMQQQRLGASPPISVHTTDLLMRQNNAAKMASSSAGILDDGDAATTTENLSTVIATTSGGGGGDLDIDAEVRASKEAINELANITGSSGATPMTVTGKRLEMKKSPAKVRRKWFSAQQQREEGEDSGRKAASSTCESEWTAETSATTTTTTAVGADNLQNDSSSSSDTTKRKNPRRISISFSDTKKTSSVTSADEKSERYCDRKTEENTLSNKVTTSQMGTSLANDLHTAHSKQNSQNSSSSRSACCDLVTQSTPNSPQFGARRTSSSASHHSHHHHHHHHQHSGSGTGSGGTTTTTTGGGAGGSAGTGAAAATAAISSHHHCSRKLSDADSTRYARKSSRRYSEGTVDTLPAHHSSFGSAYAASNYGGSTIVGGRHHHGTTTATTTTMNFQDGGGGGASVPATAAERNSNSFASSRESSTSQSTHHSQRRKISVSSHNGGKIPWCGCWGNGCL